MSYLILGLVIFLGTHSVRIVAEPWRLRTIARIGENAWKAAYSAVAIAGFVLVVWGYGEARRAGVYLYDPPQFFRYVAGLLMLVSIVLLVAAKLPGNLIKSRLGHPMIIGVKVWAFAHLITNGRLADVLLFGTFLAWAVLDFIAARRRDRAAGTVYPKGDELRTVLTVVLGVVVWAVFVAGAHEWLIGVPPFARSMPS